MQVADIVVSKPQPKKRMLASERRAWMRHPSNAEVLCGRIADGMNPRMAGRVRDVSLGGFALILKRPFQPGTILVVKVQSPEGTCTSMVFARVVHMQTLSPYEWLVGCAFASALQEDELNAFLW